MSLRSLDIFIFLLMFTKWESAFPVGPALSQLYTVVVLMGRAIIAGFRQAPENSQAKQRSPQEISQKTIVNSKFKHLRIPAYRKSPSSRKMMDIFAIKIEALLEAVCCEAPKYHQAKNKDLQSGVLKWKVAARI